MSFDVDVVVVGGGVSGLVCARSLVARGRTVRLLEARDRVGGRTLSEQIGKGTFDLGGQWLGDGQPRLEKLTRELGLETFPTFSTGRKVLEMEGRVSTYSGSIPSLPKLALIELHLTLRALEKLAATVPLGAPASTKNAEALDGQSLETWAENNIRSKSVRAMLAVATRVVFGAEPRDLSLLHVLFYVRSGGGLMHLVEIEGGAQERRFVKGAQAISTTMAAQLGEVVRLSSPVRRIEQASDAVVVRTDAEAIRARHVVVAVPPSLAARIEYAPGLPAQRDALMQRMPMGATVKALAFYDKPFWRDAGLSGEAVCDRGPVAVVFDNVSHDGAQACLVAFIVGQAAREWSNRSDAERKRIVVETLVRCFGPRAAQPTEYVEKDWSTDPWTRGCPVGVLSPGGVLAAGSTLRTPVGRIHWAGTETAHEWNGYLEGAIEAGERAAGECVI